MEKLNYNVFGKKGKEAPVKVLQFGEGNFLRAFVDYFFDIANEKSDFNGKVVVIQPIEKGLVNELNSQDGLYTLYLRGLVNGEKTVEKRVITSIKNAVNPYENFADYLNLAKLPELRFIVSNTTESGIAFDANCCFDDAPPSSFPAKLTKLLHERWKLGKKGFIILPCELIDDNAAHLKECVQKYIELWQLEKEFLNWVENENYFCPTLVDRIVTGYPKDEAAALNAENGYEDALLDVGEPFALWVIEAPKEIRAEFPFNGIDSVLITDDHKPYKRRKVRILNGAHTALIPVGLLCGRQIVGECINDKVLRSYVEKILYGEVIPTLTDMNKAEAEKFAGDVFDRFANPFISHKLLSIALNNTSKWEARILPTVKAYREMFGNFPPLLTFSFAAALEMSAKIEYSDSDNIETLKEKLYNELGADFAAIIEKHLVSIKKDGFLETLINL